MTANPANQPGGTNFATSGAKNVVVNNAGNGGFTQAIPTDTRINDYLASNGGRANSNGLYLISSGANDVSFAFGGFATSPATQADKIAYLQGSAASLANQIVALHNAGAQTIGHEQNDIVFRRRLLGEGRSRGAPCDDHRGSRQGRRHHDDPGFRSPARRSV